MVAGGVRARGEDHPAVVRDDRRTKDPERDLPAPWRVPTDTITSFAVGGSVAGHYDSWLEVLPFVRVTLLFLALPSLCARLLSEKAKQALLKVSD